MTNKGSFGIKFEDMPFTERRNNKLGALALGDQERLNRFFEKHNI